MYSYHLQRQLVTHFVPMILVGAYRATLFYLCLLQCHDVSEFWELVIWYFVVLLSIYYGAVGCNVIPTIVIDHYTLINFLEYLLWSSQSCQFRKVHNAFWLSSWHPVRLSNIIIFAF